MRPPADTSSGSEDVDRVIDDQLGAHRWVTALPLFAALARRARSSPRYRWWVLWVVLSGLLATNLLFTVFVVALPQVAKGLHTSVATITWTVTGPMLAVGVMAPLAGKGSDLWGHRRMFLTGVALETGVAALSASAPSAGVLIAARVLGGGVGAAIGASSMALVLSVFDKKDRVKALGFWSLVGAGGPVIGVAVGGPVIQYLGWRWMFVLQMPLLLLSALLAVAVLPEWAGGRERRGQRLGFDWTGAVTIGVAVAAFLTGLNRGPIWGWTSPGVIGAFVLSVVSAVSFVVAERRAPDPIFPLHYLRRRNFAFPISAQALSNFAYIGAFFLAPQLLHGVYHYGTSAVGLLVLPRPITFSLIAPVAGYVSMRVGERTSAVVGSAAVVASMGVFALSSVSGGLGPIEVALVLSGIALGVGQPALSASVANEFSAEDLGTASASQQLLNQIGAVAGIQVMQTVQVAAAHGRTSSAGLLPSFHVAYVVGGAVAAFGIAAAAMTRSTNVRRRPVVEPVVDRLLASEPRSIEPASTIGFATDEGPEPAVATQTP
ncbi:MAG TPA: MFS transporter [Acidimicrobiales bacterium]|nr:MFS transporter [Acidimicrobiales bacterium]